METDVIKLEQLDMFEMEDTLVAENEFGRDRWQEMVENAKRIAAEKGLPQKAKALIKAAMISHLLPMPIPEFLVIRPTDQPDISDLPPASRLFIRPCPYVPNHGARVAGVESGLVERNMALRQITKIQRRLIEHEPDAALIVMPYVESKLSAVVAPNQYIVIGKGNDGVTAGTSQQLVYPLQDEYVSWITYAGEDPKKTELEVIFSRKGTAYLVQLRRAAEHIRIGAPPTPEARPGFVPKGKEKITKIYVVQNLDDLGELEVLKKMDTDGLLVVQPTGSLLSHASAHCRGAGISFVVDDPANWKIDDPIVISDAAGWVVRGTYEGKSYDPADYQEQFWEGIEYARRNWDRKWGRLATFFHQYTSAPLGDPNTVAFLAGVFVGWLVMAGLAACVGEARYYRTCVGWPGSDHWGRVRKVLSVIGGYCESTLDSIVAHRDSIYAAILEVKPSWKDVTAAARFCTWAFGRPGWGGGGYGGKKWKACSHAVHKTVSAIRKKDVSLTIMRANALENAVHNNGSLFSKHLAPHYFTYATSGFPLHHPAAFKVSDLAFKVLEKIESNRPEPSQSWYELIRDLGIFKKKVNNNEPKTKKTKAQAAKADEQPESTLV